MALPFSAGNTAVVLLGDGLDELGRALGGYCQHLKSAYDAAYGPAEACEFRVVHFSGDAYGELWNMLPAGQEWIVFAVSHDGQAIANLVSALEAERQNEGGEAVASPHDDRIVPVGIVLTNAVQGAGISTPPVTFFCETASALAFCKILILHNHSARCICVDIDDLLKITESEPIRIEQYPPLERGDTGYTVFLMKVGRGVCGIINYERGLMELKAQEGWDTETFCQLYEFAASHVAPGAEVVIFDLWEPTTA